MKATPDGFQLAFTKPVNQKTAGDARSYQMNSYTYPYSNRYGGDEVDRKTLMIKKTQVSPDGLGVRLFVSPLRKMYVHELHAKGVRSRANEKLVHTDAYYTLNRLPSN